MRWVIIACIVVSAVFIISLLQTWEIWVAVNAAGAVSFLYLVGLLYRTVRPPVAQKTRRLTIAIATVVLTGIVIGWATSFVQARFQYHALHTMHKEIFHGVMMSNLYSRALKAFAEFQQQPEPKAMALGEIFQQHNPPIERGSSLIDTLQAGDGVRVHLVSISDTTVVLIGQGTFIDGENATFKNFDGRIGMAQDRLRLTPKGIDYEIQN